MEHLLAFWVLVFGFWVLGFGFWVLGFVFWVLGFPINTQQLVTIFTFLLTCAMYLQISLIISVLLQFGSFFITISLIRKTKFNASWILISLAFFLMAIRRLLELINYNTNIEFKNSDYAAAWIAVLISLTVFIASFYIRKIFIYQQQIDDIKKENELRVLSSTIETQENERKVFARELHDGLGPILSTIKMALSAISPKREAKVNYEILKKAENATDRAINSVKEISNSISPALLEKYGLTKAINTFVNNLINDHINFKVDSDIGIHRFSFNVEVVIYRIVCELINNTIQHSEALNVNIRLNVFNNVLELIYNDNGIGFDMEEAETKGMGIANIFSRAKSVEGKVEFDTRSSAGCFTKVKIPIK